MGNLARSATLPILSSRVKVVSFVVSELQKADGRELRRTQLIDKLVECPEFFEVFPEATGYVYDVFPSKMLSDICKDICTWYKQYNTPAWVIKVEDHYLAERWFTVPESDPKDEYAEGIALDHCSELKRFWPGVPYSDLELARVRALPLPLRLDKERQKQGRLKRKRAKEARAQRVRDEIAEQDKRTAQLRAELASKNSFPTQFAKFLSRAGSYIDGEDTSESVDVLLSRICDIIDDDCPLKKLILDTSFLLRRNT